MIAEALKTPKIRDTAFRLGLATANLSWAFGKKLRNAQKRLKEIFDSWDVAGDPGDNWNITPQVEASNTSLPDRLNKFYACFKPLNHTPGRRKQPFCQTAGNLSTADVKRTLSKVNMRTHNLIKRLLASGTDFCLNEVLWMTSHGSHESQPSALTGPPFGLHTCANQSSNDTILFDLCSILSHLDNRNSYTRILFIDFSLAFNNIIQQQPIAKLSLLGQNASLCNWILERDRHTPSHRSGGPLWAACSLYSHMSVLPNQAQITSLNLQNLQIPQLWDSSVLKKKQLTEWRWRSKWVALKTCLFVWTSLKSELWTLGHLSSSKIPWFLHHWGSPLDSEHQMSGSEGTAEDVLPPEVVAGENSTFYRLAQATSLSGIARAGWQGDLVWGWLGRSSGSLPPTSTTFSRGQMQRESLLHCERLLQPLSWTAGDIAPSNQVQQEYAPVLAPRPRNSHIRTISFPFKPINTFYYTVG